MGIRITLLPANSSSGRAYRRTPFNPKNNTQYNTILITKPISAPLQKIAIFMHTITHPLDPAEIIHKQTEHIISIPPVFIWFLNYNKIVRTSISVIYESLGILIVNSLGLSGQWLTCTHGIDPSACWEMDIVYSWD
jgi:hypothetical protein